MSDLFSRSADSASTEIPLPPRRMITRYLFPLFILATCGALLVFSSRDSLWPATEVDIVRAVARVAPAEEIDAGLRAEQDTPSQVSVQAPGWLEPSPYPHYVSALADGVVKDILVLEGDVVKAGQVVARLVDDDAKLEVQKREAQYSRAEAQVKAAEAHWQQPIDLNMNLAVAKARVKEAQAETQSLEALVTEQEAVLEGLTKNLERVRYLADSAVSRKGVEDTEYNHKAQVGSVQAARHQVTVSRAKILRYQAEQEAAEKKVELMIEPQQRREVAQADFREAKTALAEAKLRLQRMEVISPTSGVVMSRLVAPGGKVISAMDAPFSAQVIHLYDPQKLQVRVDIPLGDAARIGVGHKVKVIVDVLPDAEFDGQVTHFVHKADISKNTIQVKVLIENPSPLLKPDMLTRVKFLSRSGEKNSGERTNASLQIRIPISAVQQEGSGGWCWKINPTNSRVERTPLTLGARSENTWIEVYSGLQPGDICVRDPSVGLKENERVRYEEN